MGFQKYFVPILLAVGLLFVAVSFANQAPFKDDHAKTRLIKFLHQKLGFDVLAFESGLYDCCKAWQLLQGLAAPARRYGAV